MIYQRLTQRLKLLIKKSLPKVKFKTHQNISIITFEIPKNPLHGDLSCNIAFKLSCELKKSPQEIAKQLSDEISQGLSDAGLQDKISQIRAEAPGFINFYFSQNYFYRGLKEILKLKEEFGTSDIGKNRKVQIEFVSANPTGPLSLAHGRQAAIGDSLGNLLECLGFKVTREYYINDEGNQINLLCESVRARAKGLLKMPLEFPEGGYQGDYVYDIARQIIRKYGRKIKEQLLKGEGINFSDFAVSEILGLIKKDLEDFGVKFDVWYSQKTLRTQGKIKSTLDYLKKKGFIYSQDGAEWFASTKFGDDKDRVVIKSDGSLTYLAPDIAYHQDKFKRGFDWVINLWGPDHHGYVPRLKAAVKALGEKDDALSVIIVQLATLFREGKPVQMSKRRAQYITLREILDEVGRDATRFFFLMRRTDSHLDFDLELAKKQSEANPVYYVQYAHARIASILKSAPGQDFKKTDFTLLNNNEEKALIRCLNQFPNVLEIAFKQLDPYGLTDYLQVLATVFHKFYDLHRVISVDNALMQARLGLISAVKIVLVKGLRLLGVSAPQKM